MNEAPSHILLSDRFGDVNVLAIQPNNVSAISSVPSSASAPASSIQSLLKLNLVQDEMLSFGHFSLCSTLTMGGPANRPLVDSYSFHLYSRSTTRGSHQVFSGDGDHRLRVARWPATFDIQAVCLGNER